MKKRIVIAGFGDTGLLVPFGGLKNYINNVDPSVAHAVRLITAIPF